MWVLLTRHVTTEEALEAEDYLTLHVYQGDTGRVIYPSEGRVCQGIYRCAQAEADAYFHKRHTQPPTLRTG